MAQAEQSFANHTRYFPMFHFVAFPILALNVLWAAWLALRAPSLATLWALLVAVALVATVLGSRLMAIAVQDRLIRLEMRLRLRDVLPAELQSRIPELTKSHLVGLRFAGDAELPDLVRQVLGGSLKTATEIKKAVKHWQGDFLRA